MNILKLIEQIKPKHPELYNELIKIANNFQFDEILHTIQNKKLNNDNTDT